MIRNLLSQAKSTVGPRCLQNQALVISLIVECIVENELLANFPPWFLDHGMSDNMVLRSKHKPLEIMPLTKIANRNQYYVPRGITKIRAIIQ